MSTVDRIVDLSEGVIGTAVLLSDMVQLLGEDVLDEFDELGLKGSDLWCYYRECDKDMVKLLERIRSNP